ncbi:MAG: hypothetical protein CVU79_07110 [Elusimicrobia bacterium HGW-Elusimicrobia-3]|jgi:hypothetical protein|nr:MAG: hypothetical protein CVU79_07110 [Elusimicrobia bacterium HGW-Elusimicrobia-3]
MLSAAPAAADPVNAAQRRCFCLQFPQPAGVVPYFLGKMDWQECKSRKPDFLEGRNVWDLGLLDCKTLMACLETPPKEKAVREAAMKKVEDVTEELLACCEKGKNDCDKACVARLEPALNKAKARTARLEQKALRRQDACIARTAPAKPPAAIAVKNLPATSGGNR